MEEFSKVMADTISTDSNARKNAQKIMDNLVLDNNLLEFLFNYLSSQDELTKKMSGVVFLMRYIKNYWYNHTEEAQANPNKIISNETKFIFQENILKLMISVDRKLVPTIKEMIIIICKEADGYINAWPELLKLLSSILSNKNYQIAADIYDIIKKITKRYRYEQLSRSLIIEIKNAIANAGPVMTEDALSILNILSHEKMNSSEIISYIQIIKNIMHIFLSFNSPDFPEFFEDNLESWMKILQGVLNLYINIEDNIVLKEYIKLKTIGMRCLNLYCLSYYDDFSDYHNSYINIVWNLLCMAKVDFIYSKLVKQFLDYYKTLFQYNRGKILNEEVVEILINNLVLPNLQITHKELDDYEENPVNFIKIELEEVDMDSNKYHAINLLKYILNNYSSMITKFIQPLINNLLNNYYSEPNKNWMDKIIAINLIFASMIKTFAQKIGATEVKINQDEINNLIQHIFLKEFNEVKNPNLLSKIYSFKFLSTFRLQIPIEWIDSIINMLVSIINQQDHIISNAALLTLEKILFMKDINNLQNLASVSVNKETTFINLIGSLVNLINKELNIFAMRCFYRTLALTYENFLNSIIENLSISINNVFKIIISNPIEDQFNFFFFETIAILMKKLSTSNTNAYLYFENCISDSLLYIINNSITDLMGYAFQILSFELSISEQNLQIHVDMLLKILYSDDYWNHSTKYLFNPFISYIKVSLIKIKSLYEKDDAIDRLFIIVYKLIEIKTFNLAFEMLDYILNSFEINRTYNNFKKLFNDLIILYNDLKNTNKKLYRDFSKNMVIFLSKFVIKTNSQYLVDLLGNSFVLIMSDLCDFLTDLDDTKCKKLVTYSYCLIMNDFYLKFDVELLKMFTKNLISHLEKFNKLFSSFNYEKIIENEISYNSNTYNKLQNAYININLTDYKNVYDLDENKLFWSTIDIIRNNLNVNLISLVFENLTKREKEYIKTSMKTLSK